jgi:hypothetical protein
MSKENKEIEKLLNRYGLPPNAINFLEYNRSSNYFFPIEPWLTILVFLEFPKDVRPFMLVCKFFSC